MGLLDARRAEAGFRVNALTLGLVVTLAGTPAATALAQTAPPQSYEAVLRLYASGQHDAAVEHLGRFDWKTLDEAFTRFRGEVDRAGRCANCPDTLANEPIKAAAMLHIDRDRLENPPHQNVEQKPLCGGRHAERALQYAGLLAARERTRDFARRLFVAMTWHAEWDACLDKALTWARWGLTLFPEDADLRLTIGVSYEKAARLGAEEPERKLLNARRELARVIEFAPRLLTARVHLGRVQWRLGLMNDAQRTLEAALTTGGDASSLYLAHVFLGQVHERSGRAEAAAEVYRQALVIIPDGQAAAIGLAQVLLRQGDTSGAAAAAERALTRRSTSPDPHRDYNADNAAGAVALFEALRVESKQ